jgi:hypothetical protein
VGTTVRRSTLASLLALAALAGYIYWFEREPVSEEEGEPVFGVEEDAVDRIELFRPSQPVVLEKGEDGWRLASPLAAKADESEVDLLLQNLATMRLERVVAKASQVELSDFGLDRPKLEVRFHTKDGVSGSLAFGRDAPTPGNQYARRDGGEDIVLIPSHLSMNFDKSPWALRDKKVFALEGSPAAKRIEIERPEGKLSLVKESGLWFVAEPRSRADRNRAIDIASRIRETEMKEIASETAGDLERFGLLAPSRRVRVEYEGAEVLELAIGDPEDSGHYARTPAREQVFVLGSDLVKEIDAPLSEIQSKKLFDYSTFAVKRLRIEARGAAVREMEVGEEKKWRETAPAPGRDLETTKVEDLLYALNGATGTLGTAPAPELPDFTITVWSGDPVVEETLRVRKREEGVEVERAGDAISLVLTNEIWSDIEGKMKLEPSEEAKKNAK